MDGGGGECWFVDSLSGLLVTESNFNSLMTGKSGNIDIDITDTNQNDRGSNDAYSTR